MLCAHEQIRLEIAIESCDLSPAFIVHRWRFHAVHWHGLMHARHTSGCTKPVSSSDKTSLRIVGARKAATAYQLQDPNAAGTKPILCHHAANMH